MHMADALLSPVVGSAFWIASGALIGYSAKKITEENDNSKTPLMGVLGAFVFAAQMINFTIPGHRFQRTPWRRASPCRIARPIPGIYNTCLGAHHSVPFFRRRRTACAWLQYVQPCIFSCIYCLPFYLLKLLPEVLRISWKTCCRQHDGRHSRSFDGSIVRCPANTLFRNN